MFSVILSIFFYLFKYKEIKFKYLIIFTVLERGILCLFWIDFYFILLKSFLVVLNLIWIELTSVDDKVNELMYSVDFSGVPITFFSILNVILKTKVKRTSSVTSNNTFLILQTPHFNLVDSFDIFNWKLFHKTFVNILTFNQHLSSGYNLSRSCTKLKQSKISQKKIHEEFPLKFKKYFNLIKQIFSLNEKTHQKNVENINFSSWKWKSTWHEKSPKEFFHFLNFHFHPLKHWRSFG